MRAEAVIDSQAINCDAGQRGGHGTDDLPGISQKCCCSGSRPPRARAWAHQAPLVPSRIPGISAAGQMGARPWGLPSTP